MRRLPRRQVAQSFGQRFLTPVTRCPSRQAHNPPCPFPTLRQTARAQQPPRRRKPRCPNVPPILPQQVKSAQLMRRLPAINQLNPRRDGPIAVADQMRRMMRPCCQARSITSAQGPKVPNAIPAAAARITFNSARPLRVRVHKPSSSSVPYGGNRHRQRRLPQPFADRTLDAAHPVSGAGIAQSLCSQTDGDITVFLENR